MRKYSDSLNLGLEDVWLVPNIQGTGSGLTGFPAAGQNLGSHGLLPQSLQFFPLESNYFSLYKPPDGNAYHSHFPVVS